MKNWLFLLPIHLTVAQGAPSAISRFILVDQFGYRCSAEKIAVIRDPQSGFNAAESFSPTTGSNQYEVRRWSDDVVVFSGNVKKWSSGATHSQSGDKVWWFTFTAVSTPGEYYIWDKGQQVGSVKFRIGDEVYNEVMRHALRVFYYQRCGHPKSAPYAGTGWTDAACHTGSLQDLDCRLVTNPVPSTSRDLHGGWHDAGDYNKYVNFIWTGLTQLLLAYLENPGIWTDDLNIPESGNGIPDLLDEVRYELQWLLRMQEDDGSVLSLVGVQNYASASPPSADGAQRFYGPATTSATYTGAALFAWGAVAFYQIGLTAFADSLYTAAVAAWNWAEAHPGVVFYNSGVLAAGEQEVDDYGRMVRRTAAAIALYQLSGNTTYRSIVDANYSQFHMMQWGYVYPFEGTEQDVLLYYTKVPGATASVVNAIKNTYTNSVKTTNPDNFPAYKNKTDAYRAYLATGNYTWGSNSTKCTQGLIFTNMLEYNYNPSNATKYRHAAAAFLHYLHGVNPLATVYLTRLYDAGADSGIREIYHAWFRDGSSLWDRTGVSTYGPAPGYLAGGPNPYYALDGCCPSGCWSYNYLCNTASVTPPLGQPAQKSYKDWNTDWPQNSWEVTEPSMGYQANYVKLLSWFVGGSCTQPPMRPGITTDDIRLVVYPNPATQQITLLIKGMSEEATAVRIVDASGRIILEEESVQLPAIRDVKHWQPGLYLVQVRTPKRLVATHFLKQ
ncbi:MAG: glycoside hydrolase family 9 protein [Chitinophagales bacterium]|nr:glycoside hydrolase family 9 protein [Chitinophagales bacterium]MDW8393883.1 glycoside hydrolase family 9 protein [Chitinophagales bacterium]